MMTLSDQIIETSGYEGRSYDGHDGRVRWSRCVLWDDEVTGLGLRITPTGRKTFVVSYRENGVKRMKTLGAWGRVDLEEARRRARELLAGIQSEEDLPLPEPPGPPEREVLDIPRRVEIVPVPPPSEGGAGKGAERRLEPRVRVLQGFAENPLFHADIINLSRTGMSVEVSMGLRVGALYRLKVGDRMHSMEIDARVKWCRLRELQSMPDGTRVPVYQAGLRFTKIHSSRPGGFWSRLQAEPESGQQPAAEHRERRPLLAIESPANGATFHHSPIRVTGCLDRSLLDTPVEVNGVVALVEGQRFEAIVPLEEGSNRLMATVATSSSFLCSSSPVRVVLTSRRDRESAAG